MRIGAFGRATQQTIDGAEYFGILVVGRPATGEQLSPHLVAHAIFDLAHERLDTENVVSQSGFTLTCAAREEQAAEKRGRESFPPMSRKRLPTPY